MSLADIISNEDVIDIKSITNSNNISRQAVYNFIKNKKMEKVGPGIYIMPGTIEDKAYTLFLRCPKGIISHDDALYYYGLIDREPINHSITIYSGYNPSVLTKSGYKVFTIDKKLLNLGKTEVTNNFGHVIQMYDLERTICDLMRSRSNYEIEDIKTALKSYVKRTDKNLHKLMDYAKKLGVEKLIKSYLKIIL